MPSETNSILSLLQAPDRDDVEALRSRQLHIETKQENERIQFEMKCARANMHIACQTPAMKANGAIKRRSVAMMDDLIEEGRNIVRNQKIRNKVWQILQEEIFLLQTRMEIEQERAEYYSSN